MQCGMDDVSSGCVCFAVQQASSVLFCSPLPAEHISSESLGLTKKKTHATTPEHAHTRTQQTHSTHSNKHDHANKPKVPDDQRKHLTSLTCLDWHVGARLEVDDESAQRVQLWDFR